MKNGTLKKRIHWLKKKWLWGVGLLIVIGGVVASMSGGTGITVTPAMVEKGSVQKLVEETAVVSSRLERQIYAAGAGEVHKVYKSPGDNVVKGEVLAELDVRDMQLSIAELSAQKSALEAGYRDALTPSTDAIVQARAAVEADQLAVAAAQRIYEQTKTLEQAGAGTKEDRRQAEEALKAAQKSLEISESQYSETRKGLTEEQKNKYQAEIEVIQTQIEQLRLNKDKLQILSPIDGVVTLKEIDPGQQIVTGTVLFEVADAGDIQLETDILAADSGNIKRGTPFRAYDEDAGIEITGSVERIYPKAFSKQSELGIEQKRIHMELKPDDVTQKLLLGMELDLELIEAHADGVLRVPDSAIFKIDTKPHVFIINEGKAVLTPIEIGLEGKKYTEIKKGLKEGQEVIDAPGNDLIDGAKVQKE